MNIQKLFFVVLALLLMTTSCNKSTDLSDVIPADATYIIHLDNKALIEKSQYDIFQNPTVQQGINFYKAFLKDQDKINILDEFLKDPNSLGLDVKKELYFYTNYKTYGIVLGVNNADKIKDAILKFLPVKEEDILKEGGVYTLSPESMITAAWDENKMLMLVDMSTAYYFGGKPADKEPLDVRKLAIEQLKQKSDKSINSVKSFADFVKNRKDISIFYNMDGMENFFEMTASTRVLKDKLLPFQAVMAEFKGVSMGMYTAFETGKATVTGDYYYDSPDTEKRFKELMSGMVGSIKGDHLKYVVEEPLFMMTANTKGEGAFQYLSRLGFLNLMNERFSEIITAEQLENLIRNIDGDLTFALSSIREENVKIDMSDEELFFEEGFAEKIPEMMLFAEVKDPAYVKSFIQEQMNKNDVRYKEVSPTIFLIEEAYFKVYLGVHNNTFFATNIESVYDNLDASGLKNNYSNQINNKMFFITGNLQPLRPFLEESRTSAMFVDLFDELGQYEMVTSNEDFHAEGKIEFKSKDKNSLAVICQHIDSMISNIRTPMGF